MKKKKLYVDGDKRKLYVVVHLFKKEKEMQEFYKKWCPQDKNHNIVGGVAVNRTYYKVGGRKKTLMPRTGELLLSLERMGTSVVGHEIMHAVFWAHGFRALKPQYPITIKSMKEEEQVLRKFSLAVREFYGWYWKVKKSVS